MEKYQNDINNVAKSKEALKKILGLYKETYPIRFISNYYLKRFYEAMMQTDFLPEYEEYEKINLKDELFESTMIFPIKMKSKEYGLTFPLIVDISKLSRNIDKKNMEKVTFDITDLVGIMTDSYWDDYEKDNKMRLEKRDILVEEKAKNPIIIMPASEVTRPTIINGNHRIMYFAKNKKNRVEGYCVTAEEICKFAITKDYETLYYRLLDLLNKV